MQNYKTVRELDDMIISTKYMKGQPKNYISDLYFENFPYTLDLPMLKDEFKTKVFSGSRYASEAMHSITEVEMTTAANNF